MVFYSSKLSNLNIFWVNSSVLIMGDFLWLESLKKVRQLITQLLFYAVGRQSFITRYSQPLPGSGRNSKATELHAWQSSRWQPYKSDWQKWCKSMHFWQYLLLKQESEPLKGECFLTAFAFLSSGSSRTHKHTQWKRLTYFLSFSHIPMLQPVVPTVLFETLQLPTKC